MSALKLQTLNQKLWAIVFISFVLRVIMFFVLPNKASFLAPDEGTYAFLANWIGQSKPASEFPSYGQSLYLSGRTLIVPASLLFRIGLNELDAVRLVASLYGFTALILLVSIILKFFSQNITSSTRDEGNENIITGIILVFAFMPSHFVWSNLGLRESATEFWLITAFLSFFLMINQQQRIRAYTLLLLNGSIVMTFSARPQVGWVLGVSLVIYLIFNFRQKKTYFILPLVLCSVVLGSVLNLGGYLSTGSTGSTGTTQGPLENAFNPILKAGEIVEYKQSANQVGAESVIKSPQCPLESRPLASSPPTKYEAYLCIAWRAPYMVSTFLFRPILGVDVTSTSSLVAAVENIFWIALFMTIFVLAIRRRAISFLAPILPALIFFCLYVLGASAYQGNMGTGFRHKSLILWVVLLLIFALAWRKPEGTSTKPRNNSQESAV